MSYYEKYIKYKSKYNLVKKQIGSSSSSYKILNQDNNVECKTEIPTKNIEKNFSECKGPNSIIGYDIKSNSDTEFDKSTCEYTSYNTLIASIVRPDYRDYINPLSVLHNIISNRTYSVVFVSKFQPLHTSNFAHSRPRIVLIFEESLTSKTITDNIKLIAYKSSLGTESEKLVEYNLKDSKNIEFKKNNEVSTFNEFYKYITDLGIPVIVLGEYDIERKIYPEFHAKLNRIKINFIINEIFKNGNENENNVHKLTIKEKITINFT
jgi:hypothetical protein